MLSQTAFASTPDGLVALNDAAWRAVAARADKIARTMVEVPAAIPAGEIVSESRFGADFPALRHLDCAIERAAHGPLAKLAQMFAGIVSDLHWSQNLNYTTGNCAQSFLDGYAYAAFSGPQGPIHIDAPRGGFMLMGPDVFYKDHNHAPVEVYLILTPGAQWRLNEGEWFDVEAGDLILHHAWQMHAMRTRGEPMLAFAGWLEKGSRTGIGFAKDGV